ncbi:MAG: hypothetical protein RSB71_03160 [Bacilli bacterium]
MYQNIPNLPMNYMPYSPVNYPNNMAKNGQDDRFLGALAFPFLLGGVTGAALAPAFWRPSPYGRPCCQPYPMYPPYGPYYR